MALTAITVLGLADRAFGAPIWNVYAAANPAMEAGSDVQYIVRIANVGDVAAPETFGGDTSNCVPGAPAPADPTKCYAVTATFPAGMTPVSVTRPSGATCTTDLVANTISCSVPGSARSQQVATQDFKVVTFTASIDPGADGTLTSVFDVSGAGGGSAATVETVRVSDDPPAFGVADFDGQVVADAAGSPFTQAAGHAYAASTAIELNAVDLADPLTRTLWPVEAAKDLVVDLPPGFVASPAGIDRCTLVELSNSISTQPRTLCPATSQIGTTLVRANLAGQNIVLGPVPVFNMVTGSGTPARFGFNAFGSIVLLDAAVRSEGDYGASVVVSNIPTALPLQATELTLWGVPSDASHDSQRACPGAVAPWSGGPTCASGAPRKAFLRNPTSCTPHGVGLTTTIRATSWQDPTDVKTKSFESHLPPSWPAAPEDWGRPQGPTGCDRVPFDPTLTGTPGSTKAAEPTGFAFDLSLPQTDDPDAIGQSDLRKAVVTLPQGVRVNPSSAAGLAGCSSAQIKLDSREAPSCPDASKIGTLTIDTPLLDERLEGGIYLAAPFDNPFDSLIAIYIVARGPGFHLKLPGHVAPDASKGGQLTTTFDDQPQLPFERLHLEFKGGPHAPIALPRQCGTYTTHAELTSWSGRTVSSDSSFVVDQGCDSGFAPGFAAGTETSAAGKSSSFHLRMTRGDADQELSGVTVDMPGGLVGRIADAVLCADGAANAGSCGDGSRIGSVVVGAGAGPEPFYVTGGRVHLTGPYKGAPFGLSIVVPAVAGPFDLGTVVVRSAVFVDRHSAEVRVVSDPLPTILQGIPLDVKDVRVAVDRPGFWLNPTSCAEKTIAGAITSTAGASAGVSTRFQAYDCASLDLRPGFALRVGGRRRTQRGRSTALKTKLRMPDGGANLRSVQVTLPTVLNARLTVINDACTRAEYDSGSDACEFARTGSAAAVTPLLRDPLRGGVYFVRNGNPLPDLFVRLRGQVDFDLIGRITIPGSKRLRTTFELVPDVPVSMFALRLEAGRDGSVGNAANLCSTRARRARAEVDFVGQNGKTVFSDKRLRVKGCRQRSARARDRRRGRRGSRRGR